MTALTTILQALWLLVRGAADAMLGRTRKHYDSSILIHAPREVVWNVVTARQITFDDIVPVVIDVAPQPDNPGIIAGTITVGESAMPIAYRELEMRPFEGGLFEFIRAGSDPFAVPGIDYFVSFTLHEEPGGTLLSLGHDVTHTRFLTRIGIPLGVSESAGRIKRHAERLAGTAPAAKAKTPVGDAVMTGLLTFVSFMLLFGADVAAMLIGLILIHEAGHAIAMRYAGQPVQGIYFIPFLGGVAVAAAPHASEEERGFVALMGPGVSLLTTAALAAGGLSTGNATLIELALLSAILNGMNLAPVMPLDGGHVFEAIASRWDPEMAAIPKVLFLIASLGAAAYMEMYFTAGLLVLGAHSLLSPNSPRSDLAPISRSGQAWLSLAYAASIAFYISVALALV